MYLSDLDRDLSDLDRDLSDLYRDLSDLSVRRAKVSIATAIRYEMHHPRTQQRRVVWCGGG